MLSFRDGAAKSQSTKVYFPLFLNQAQYKCSETKKAVYHTKSEQQIGAFTIKQVRNTLCSTVSK